MSRKIYSKRINEKKSSNSRGKEGNVWLHPDIVGMENLALNWEEKVKHLPPNAEVRIAKLWSFEVKQQISAGTVRKDFFQAVSNSSWANFGYLVAAEISANVFEELQLLSELHGIGVIRLNKESPEQSTIEIHARERLAVDWGTCNRIAEQNPDFSKFVGLVAQFYSSKDIPVSGWDINPASD